MTPFTPEPRAIVAVVIAVTAVIYDVRTRRIPNYLTFGGAASAVVFALVQAGPTGVLGSLAGWVLGVVFFFPFFALGGMGAGDVKLLAALGAWLGPSETVWLAIFSSMAGGVMAAAVAIATGYVRQAAANLWVMLVHWRTVGLSPVPGVTLGESSAPRLAYALPIAIGVLCTLWRR
jgi:prepilin peptidase CpaA